MKSKIIELLDNILIALVVIPNFIFLILFAIKMYSKGLSENEGENFINHNYKIFKINAICFYIVLGFYLYIRLS
jgi:hypothetical protein